MNESILNAIQNGTVNIDFPIFMVVVTLLVCIGVILHFIIEALKGEPEKEKEL